MQYIWYLTQGGTKSIAGEYEFGLKSVGLSGVRQNLEGDTCHNLDCKAVLI